MYERVEMPKLNWLFFLIFGVIGILFYLNPQWDIAISSLFFDERFDKDYLPYKVVYEGTRVVTFVAVLSLLILLILSFFGKEYIRLTKKHLLFLLFAMILGPGIVVNVIFKDHWGRPRPVKVQEFKGELQHTPPFVMTKQCERNCSFVCGHASVGFVFVALAFIYRRKEKEIFWASVAAGSLIGLVRVAQGGHFFSDVIFSFVFIYITIRLLYFAMYRKERSLTGKV